MKLQLGALRRLISEVLEDDLDEEINELRESIYKIQGAKGIKEYLDKLPPPVKGLTRLLSKARNVLQEQIKVGQVER
jgi:hypothetical protein